jgi:hypothetical protein
MATLKINLDVDDKKLNELTSKKRNVNIELKPSATKAVSEGITSDIKTNVSRNTRKHASKLESVLTSDISSLFGELSSIFKNKIFKSILSTVGKFALGFGAIATVGVVYAGRQLANAFSSTATSFEALRSTFTNVPNLTKEMSESVQLAISSTAKKYGVPFEEVASAVENALPAMRDRSIEAINNVSDIFGQLKYLENISPEEYMSLVELSTISQRPIEEIGQLYNVLTDNVGLQSRQVVTFLRRVYSSFSGSLEEMMAALEYIMQNVTPDPREAVRIVKEGSEQLSKIDFSKNFNYDKLKDEAKTLMTMYYSQNYADIAQKYYNPGTLAGSYAELMNLPASQMEQFFKQAKEQMNVEMMNFAEKNKGNMEQIYKGIDISAKKYFGELSPLMKPLFISPETGMPTTLTAMIPIIEKLTGLQVTAESILEVLKSASDTGSKAIDIGEWMLRTGEKIFNSFGTYNKYSPIGGMP